jgi:ribosome recycling factor
MSITHLLLSRTWFHLHAQVPFDPFRFVTGEQRCPLCKVDETLPLYARHRLYRSRARMHEHVLTNHPDQEVSDSDTDEEKEVDVEIQNLAQHIINSISKLGY